MTDFEKLDPKLKHLQSQILALPSTDQRHTEIAMLRSLLAKSQREDKSSILIQCDHLENLLRNTTQQTLIQKGLTYDDTTRMVQERIHKAINLGKAYITRFFENVDIFMKQAVQELCEEFRQKAEPMMREMQKAFIRDYRAWLAQQPSRNPLIDGEHFKRIIHSIPRHQLSTDEVKNAILRAQTERVVGFRHHWNGNGGLKKSQFEFFWTDNTEMN
jgi:hypothetical protein